jgi:hypothetical protein
MLCFVRACCALTSFWLLGVLLAETKHTKLSVITSRIFALQDLSSLRIILYTFLKVENGYLSCLACCKRKNEILTKSLI